MSSFSERLNSPRFVRRFSWIAGLVLVAGIVAFSIAYFGNTADSTPTAAPTGPAPSAPVERPTVPIDKQARIVAGEFILNAVQRDVPNARLRKQLARAWKLVNPQSSELMDCGGHRCTYKEWLTGNIPVQPYPAKALDTASFAIEESYPNQVVLQVALLPKDGAQVQGQIFWISLVKKNGKWLVDEWSPRVINPVPQAGD
jgi:hypothetical protein